MPQHHAFACSRGLLRAESASHKVQAAEFTGRARWGISSTALTPTARVAEGSFGSAQFATGTREGRPCAPHRTRLPRDGNRQRAGAWELYSVHAVSRCRSGLIPAAPGRPS